MIRLVELDRINIAGYSPQSCSPDSLAVNQSRKPEAPRVFSRRALSMSGCPYCRGFWQVILLGMSVVDLYIFLRLFIGYWEMCKGFGV